jgi:hypothetical protein
MGQNLTPKALANIAVTLITKVQLKRLLLAELRLNTMKHTAVRIATASRRNTREMSFTAKQLQAILYWIMSPMTELRVRLGSIPWQGHFELGAVTF